MGVKRLWTFIKENMDNIVEYVDLVEKAKRHSEPLKILIDFYSFEHYLKDHFWESNFSITTNPVLKLDGGEYDQMDSYITSFVQALRSVNIELEFFLDGSKGSSQHDALQKMDTWKSRHIQDQRGLAKCFQFLRGEISLQQITSKLVRPTLQEVQNIDTILKLGCKVHQRISGEADCLIAQHLRDDSAAVCIFSNDTDFCIFPHGCYTCHELFDVTKQLGMGLNSLTVKVPEHLKCGIISSKNLAYFLKLPSPEYLIELSIIGGNDFTAPDLQRCAQTFSSNYEGKIQELAGMVKQYRSAEFCPYIGNCIRGDLALQEKVDYSRQFYNLTLLDTEEKDQGHFFSILKEAVLKVKVPATFIAMHRGFYWRRTIFEDPQPGLPTAEEAYSHLRAFVYSIILPGSNETVVEYGRTSRKVLEHVPIHKIPRVPNLIEVVSNSLLTNLQVFENIITHQEYTQQECQPFFKIYGIRMGFICHLLRYFLLLNWKQNLFISPREFYVVAAWMLGQHNSDHHRKLYIIPSPRSATLENWFLLLYRNAYAFLGSALGVAQEFPEPKSLFSGATWVALYTSYMIEDPNQRFREQKPGHISSQEMRTIASGVKQIIKENINTLNKLVDGCFQIDLRHC